MRKLIFSFLITSVLSTSAFSDVSVNVTVPDYKRNFGLIVKGKKTTRLSISVPECLGSLAFDVQDGYSYTVDSDQNCVMRVTFVKDTKK